MDFLVVWANKLNQRWELKSLGEGDNNNWLFIVRGNIREARLLGVIKEW